MAVQRVGGDGVEIHGESSGCATFAGKGSPWLVADGVLGMEGQGRSGAERTGLVPHPSPP